MSPSSSPALTCNRICWPLSSSNLLASLTKQSVLVLSHPENDHAALIREAFQERPSHHWQHNSIHLSIKLSLLRLSASGLGLGEEDQLELFIERARLLDLLSRGHYQQERHDIHNREHPGPLQSNNPSSGFEHGWWNLRTSESETLACSPHLWRLRRSQTLGSAACPF